MTGSPHHSAYPPRALLRPGVHVCRRGDGQVQVGLDLRLALTAPDTDEVRAILDGLRHGVAPPPLADLTPVTARLCSALLEKDLVIDADALLPALGDAANEEARESLTAMYVDAGRDGRARSAQRAATVVAVDNRRLPRAAERCRQLLGDAGVTVVESTVSRDRTVDLALHLSAGEPDRSHSDRWVSRDVPHLIVQCTEGFIRVGPFVVPGRTACLRCLDAHHTDRDPRRPLVVEQYAAARGPRDGLPEPIHHDLLDLAVIWAARDTVTWVDGGRPRTWSTTVTIDPALELLPTPWRPHARCGCTWASQVACSS